jgi:Tol biopolymer transport system component
MRLLILARLLCLAIMAGLGTAQVALASSAAIVQVTADGTSSVRPSWSPDGSRIAFQSSTKGTYGVYTMAADGSNRKILSQGDVDDRHPAWSPDGTKLVVDSGTEIKREIWVLDVATGARTQVTNLGGFASFPAFSPDGSKLSFYNYKNGALDIWTVGVDGSSPAQITQGLASETKSQCTFACHVASWSPDGSRLAFADGDQLHVWTMRADDGTDRIKVSEDDPTGRSHFPAFLADGRLSYVTEHINPGQSWTDIWAVTPGSGQPRAALLQDVQVQGPFEFSPDGQKVLFASPRNGSFDIYMADLQANGQQALQQVSSETELAPALAAGHPTQVPLPQAAGAPGNAVVTPTAAPAAAAAPQSGPIPDSISPYVLALIGLAGAWVVVEGVLVARRRMRRRNVRTDGD